MLRRVFALLTATFTTGALALTAPAGAGRAAEPAASSSPGTPAKVTLITGDRVTFTPAADGKHTFSVEPAPRPGGRPVVFYSQRNGPRFYVFPSDAFALVSADRLDKTLFDLPELVREGYDDAQASALPIIVAFTGKPSEQTVRDRAGKLAGAKQTATLRTIRGAALRVDRGKDAGRFWQQVAPAPNRALAAGFDKIWLDRKIKLALNESVPQIGAPQAWKAGFDGKGVPVAVIDTGIDETHPDLKGKVTETKNFTDDPDAGDSIGHGTHVASTIAGTGVASAGKYKGVAPAATLRNAKVFNSNGASQESWITQGMEWAAHGGAKVINMSLGTDDPTDGRDPTSLTLNGLTQETGALFTVAAGNNYRNVDVGSPGSADAALTVGAVDKKDALADFSDRGPRIVDAAVKPEITAPGVNIVAARGKDTDLGRPVDDNYTALDGTSMATPHVAGAAAILAQANPSWRAAQLKDALVSTTKDAGRRYYEQGTGRVDVARAVLQKVYGPGTVNLGRLSRDDGAKPVTQRLTYRNDTAAPVTLGLGLTVTGYNGKPGPRDAAKLSSSSITVPARGTAGVDITVSPAVGGSGAYGAVVTAKSANGAVGLRTAVGYYVMSATAQVTAHATDFQGKPLPFGELILINDDYNANDPFYEPYYRVDIANGTATVRVPQGRYDAFTNAFDDSMPNRRFDMTTTTEVNVTGNTDIALDARKNVPARARTPGPTDAYNRMVSYKRWIVPAHLDFGLNFYNAQDWNTYISPTKKITRGGLELDDMWRFGDRLLDVQVRQPQPFNLAPVYDPLVVSGALAGERTVPLVWAGAGQPGDFEKIDARGRLALVRVPRGAGGWTDAWYAADRATTNAIKAGALGIVPYSEIPGALAITPHRAPALTAKLPQLFVTNADGEKLRGLTERGPVTIGLRGRAAPAATYTQLFYDAGAIPRVLDRRVDPSRMVKVPMRYHADRPGLDYTVGALVTSPQSGGAVVTQRFHAPASWTEYFGPTDGRFSWARGVDLGGQGATATMYSPERPGRRGAGAESWFEAPVRYGAAEPSGGTLLCAFCRAGDTFVPGLYQMDAAGHLLQLRLDERTMQRSGTKIRLFRGDQEIPSNHQVSSTYPAFQLSPQPASYRLDVDIPPPTTPPATEQPEAVFRTVPHVLISWRFRSARPTAPLPAGYVCAAGEVRNCAFQPLIELRYWAGLDVNNQAATGRPYSFNIQAGPHSGAAGAGWVNTLKLEYSTDEGKTWRRATVTPQGPGYFRVTVDHTGAPAAGFVWLRAHAADTAGNQVDQTVQRAYRLAGGTG